MQFKRRRKIAKKISAVLRFEKLRYVLWVKAQNRPVACPHDGIYISSRNDRYGANSIPWMNAIALARVQKLPLYHHCSVVCYRYRNSVIHRTLVDYAVRSRHCTTCDLHGKDGWFGAQHTLLMDHANGKPLPDVFADSGLKKELFDRYATEASARHWVLPVDPGRCVVIHVRLDDIRHQEKENKQGFIGEQNLRELIEKLHSRYPAHHIHLVTSPNKADIATCQAAVSSSNVDCTVSGNADIDYDLYLMMRSDILILSRSTFGFIAALLHQGSAVFSYTNWAHFEELVGAHYAGGNGTNRSNYIKVLD